MIENFAATAKKQAIFWLITFVIVMLFLYIFRGILLPFVAGMALAYFLDPVADMLERAGFTRLIATVLIVFFFVMTFIFSFAIFLPLLVSQAQSFAANLPELVKSLQELVTNTESEWLRALIGDNAVSIQERINQWLGQGAGWISTILQQIWSSGLALVNIVSLLIVTPVVAFYMLLDWDRMVEKVDSWLPRDSRNTIHSIMGDIDSAVAGFVRGQGTLCLILGVSYAIGLTAVGLNFGLLIGLFAGLISFIPYVGSIAGLVVSIGVALVQFWPDWIPVAIVAGIFAVGQFVEGNILQPKLVGKSVGLHPVWLMFALFAFGSLMGFTGMLIAVPAAAAVGVVVRFALANYLDSTLYAGHSKKDDAQA